MPTINSREYREFRAAMKSIWQPINRACHICGQATIDWDGPAMAPNSFELDHVHARKHHPELLLVPSNALPSHTRCNRNKGAGQVKAGLGETDEEW